ncbi:MAG: hypothetical protein JXO22_14605, partial [Phycisphaerae bacterium]|nr:hypothetical protein [Phycisphaerae bacterium]
VGSSHFEWFETDCFLPAYRFVNRAIASDRLGIGERGIMRRLDISVFDVQPSFIVFNNGVNDLGELWRTGEPSLEEIFDAYNRVIAAIRSGAADTDMLIVNELPTAGRYAELNRWIPRLNARIVEVAREQGCVHLDMHSVLADARGALPDGLTTDGLHLNDPGYALLAEHLAPHLPAPPSV